jgi:hypothetical protein
VNDDDSAGRPNYAPAEFERDADAEGVANSALALAMGRLLKANRIMSRRSDRPRAAPAS